jgi:hypothetical protein
MHCGHCWRLEEETGIPHTKWENGKIVCDCCICYDEEKLNEHLHPID